MKPLPIQDATVNGAESNLGESWAKMSPCEDYIWRQLPLSQRTGTDVFSALFQPQTSAAGVAGIATLLESPYPSTARSEHAQAMTRYSICAGAPRHVKGVTQLWTPKLGQSLPLLQQMAQYRRLHPTASAEGTTPDENLPFVGGWLGWLGYDVAWEIERLPWLKADTLPFPMAFWYEPSAFAVLDHQAQRLWLAAETTAALQHMEKRLQGMSRQASQQVVPAAVLASTDSEPHSDQKLFSCQQWMTRALRFETSQAEFEQAVRRAKAHIRAGDVFQVNHSLRFQAQTNMPSWEVYKTLHRINPSPFASYWHTPWGAVVSCSPERLVQLQGGMAQSRPIAGTRPRGATAADDRAIAHELIHDPKERAEHIMLVDLARNDLGRVCQWGSIRADELMTVERYSHVMHLVSNVVGQLHSDQRADQLIAALFPGGTITGCPKVRCMEIIEALEPVRRSLFYGSCGYFDRGGRLDLNILIRTLLMAPFDPTTFDPAQGNKDSHQSSTRTVWGQVGAGIVADSEPAQEWRESWQKAKAQLLALGLEK